MTAPTRGSRARFLEQRVVDPATLTPYPGNPNIGDVEAVRASLRANGQYRTPVTRRLPDGTLQVLAGHTTRLAAIAEHMPLRVDIVDADDKTARRIVLADNRTAQLSRYDETLLLDILDGGDLAGTGWDDAAFDDLRARMEEAQHGYIASEDTPDGEPQPARSVEEIEAAYAAGHANSRVVVLGYEGARYVWVVTQLGLLAEEFDVDANADVVLRLIEQAVGDRAPETEGA